MYFIIQNQNKNTPIFLQPLISHIKHPLTLATLFFSLFLLLFIRFIWVLIKVPAQHWWAKHCGVGVCVALATKPHSWLQWKCNGKRRADIHILGGPAFSLTHCWSDCFYIFNSWCLGFDDVCPSVVLYVRLEPERGNDVLQWLKG